MTQPARSDRSTMLDFYPVHMTLRPRYGDMDIQRHVNNVSIARYFEESRLNLHLAVERIAPDAFTSMVLARVEIDFLLEVDHPDELVMAVGVGRIGTSSFEQLAALFQGGLCKATSRAVSVRRNPDRSGSQALDDQERGALTSLAVDHHVHRQEQQRGSERDTP